LFCRLNRDKVYDLSSRFFNYAKKQVLGKIPFHYLTETGKTFNTCLPGGNPDFTKPMSIEYCGIFLGGYGAGMTARYPSGYGGVGSVKGNITHKKIPGVVEPSNHAIKRSIQRGFTSDDISNIQLNGKVYYDPKYNSYVKVLDNKAIHYAPDGKTITTVTNNPTSRLIPIE
jgi:hypothetical protein